MHVIRTGADELAATTCDDNECVTQGCPEHPAHDELDHTYEQHHSPEDHQGDGPCRCDVYLVEPDELAGEIEGR